MFIVLKSDVYNINHIANIIYLSMYVKRTIKLINHKYSGSSVLILSDLHYKDRHTSMYQQILSLRINHPYNSTFQGVFAVEEKTITSLENSVTSAICLVILLSCAQYTKAQVKSFSLCLENVASKSADHTSDSFQTAITLKCKYV